MVKSLSKCEIQEEQIVAELSSLGITYLSLNIYFPTQESRPVGLLLADIVRQSSSRVRTAVIALLLHHPQFSFYIREAISHLHSKNRLTLKIYYTAAVLLQRKNALALQEKQGEQFEWLPDFFGKELGVIDSRDPDIALGLLGKKQSLLLGMSANWVGTYNKVYAGIMA